MGSDNDGSSIFWLLCPYHYHGRSSDNDGSSIFWLFCPCHYHGRPSDNDGHTFRGRSYHGGTLDHRFWNRWSRFCAHDSVNARHIEGLLAIEYHDYEYAHVLTATVKSIGHGRL